VARVRAGGGQTTEQAAGGLYTFVAGPEPTYIRHRP
jgi:hypothetical protein